MANQLLSPQSNVRRQDSAAEDADRRAGRYWEEVAAAFGRACAAMPCVPTTTLAIGGRAVRLRFAGAALVERVLPAFAHLPTVRSESPDLTVDLWDSVSTGTALPPPPWKAADLVARGDVVSCTGSRFRTAFFCDRQQLNVIDTARGQAVFWVRDAAAIPSWESAGPLRPILHWWAELRGRQFSHAAAVGVPSGGVLLGGPSGAGKSTTALACLQSDLLYAGDDFVLLQTDPAPYVHSLYCTGKLDAQTAARFPWLGSAIGNPQRNAQEKALLYLRHVCPARLTTGFPIRAVLLPHLTASGTPRLRELPAATALRILAPSSIFPLPCTGAASLHNLARLVRSVPCYRLELGPDHGQVTRLIERLVASF